MGWCHEFGPIVNPGCSHPMTAGATSCHCDECGFVCTGKFSGCSEVWARGPREVTVAHPVVEPLLGRRRLIADAIAAAVGEAVEQPAPIDPHDIKILRHAVDHLEEAIGAIRADLITLRLDLDELGGEVKRLASSEVLRPHAPAYEPPLLTVGDDRDIEHAAGGAGNGVHSTRLQEFMASSAERLRRARWRDTEGPGDT